MQGISINLVSAWFFGITCLWDDCKYLVQEGKQYNQVQRREEAHFITSLLRFATVTENTIDATVIMMFAFWSFA